MKAKDKHENFPHSYDENHYTYKKRFCVKTYQLKSEFQTASKMSLIFASICFLLAISAVSSLHAGSHSTPLTSKISVGVQENLDLFVVIFADNNVIKCIGYIISWRVVLGAAQCFFGKGLSNFTVSRSFDYVNGEPSCVYKITKVIVHEKFNLTQPKPYLNDIAVTLLEQRVRIVNKAVEDEVRSLVLKDEIIPFWRVSSVAWARDRFYKKPFYKMTRIDGWTYDKAVCQSSLGYAETHESLLCVYFQDVAFSQLKQYDNQTPCNIDDFKLNEAWYKIDTISWEKFIKYVE